MVWMEPAAYASSVAPVFNDLDLLVVAYDGTSETTFYPNKLTAKDPDNTVEMVVIPSVDSYESFNVRRRELSLLVLMMMSLSNKTPPSSCLWLFPSLVCRRRRRCFFFSFL